MSTTFPKIYAIREHDTVLHIEPVAFGETYLRLTRGPLEIADADFDPSEEKVIEAEWAGKSQPNATENQVKESRFTAIQSATPMTTFVLNRIPDTFLVCASSQFKTATGVRTMQICSSGELRTPLDSADVALLGAGEWDRSSPLILETSEHGTKRIQYLADDIHKILASVTKGEVITHATEYAVSVCRALMLTYLKRSRFSWQFADSVIKLMSHLPAFRLCANSEERFSVTLSRYLLPENNWCVLMHHVGEHTHFVRLALTSAASKHVVRKHRVYCMDISGHHTERPNSISFACVENGRITALYAWDISMPDTMMTRLWPNPGIVLVLDVLSDEVVLVYGQLDMAFMREFEWARKVYWTRQEGLMGRAAVTLITMLKTITSSGPRQGMYHTQLSHHDMNRNYHHVEASDSNVLCHAAGYLMSCPPEIYVTTTRRRGLFRCVCTTCGRGTYQNQVNADIEEFLTISGCAHCTATIVPYHVHSLVPAEHQAFSES